VPVKARLVYPGRWLRIALGIPWNHISHYLVGEEKKSGYSEVV
jgi:hypothetical protein